MSLLPRAVFHVSFPDVPFDEKLILSNEGALSLTEVPKNLGIIGAGVIGLEMGSVWNRLGSEVRILSKVPSPAFYGRFCCL